MDARITNITSALEKSMHNPHVDVAVVRFDYNGRQRYIKAHHSSTRHEDLKRDVTAHLEYLSKFPDDGLADYGEYAF